MSTHKILVIDDSKVIRMRVKDMLPEGNFDIIEAKDGLEGFNLIKTENPNLIMLDFLLPKMSGWEVYQEIQKQQQFRSIPLVLMSGRKEEVTDKISEPFELFSFVEKPFDREQLVSAIRDAMLKAKKQPQIPTGNSPQIVRVTLIFMDYPMITQDSLPLFLMLNVHYLDLNKTAVMLWPSRCID